MRAPSLSQQLHLPPPSLNLNRILDLNPKPLQPFLSNRQLICLLTRPSVPSAAPSSTPSPAPCRMLITPNPLSSTTPSFCPTVASTGVTVCSAGTKRWVWLLAVVRSETQAMLARSFPRQVSGKSTSRELTSSHCEKTWTHGVEDRYLMWSDGANVKHYRHCPTRIHDPLNAV